MGILTISPMKEIINMHYTERWVELAKYGYKFLDGKTQTIKDITENQSEIAKDIIDSKKPIIISTGIIETCPIISSF